MQSEALSALKRYLATADHVEAAQHHFIGLENVAREAGPRWPALKERAFIAARSLIERHVDPGDIIIQCDSGFLVVFTQATGARARRLTSRMRHELAEFFLGDPLLSRLDLASTSSRMDIDSFSRTLETARPDRRPATAPAPSRSAAPRLESALYVPVWDARAQAVGVFHAMPVYDIPPDHLTETALADPARAEEGLEISRAIIAQAETDLTALFASGGRSAVIAPAPYGALVNPRTRTGLVQTLAALPEPVRRHLHLRLESAPLDAPAAVIGEACRTLLGHCARLLIHAPAATLSLDRFAQTGASLAGCDYPRHAGPHAAAQDLARLAALARRLDCASYVDGVDPGAPFKVALASPARFISGDAIGPPGPLGAAFRLERAALEDPRTQA